MNNEENNSQLNEQSQLDNETIIEPQSNEESQLILESQPSVQLEPTIEPQLEIQQSNPNEFSSNRKPVAAIIALIVVFLGLIGYGIFCFMYIQKPTVVYRNLIKKGINEIYNDLPLDSENINSTINMSLNLDLQGEILDKSIIDFINKTTLGLNYQLDKKQEQFVLHLNADYDKDSLIDLKTFLDNKNKKTYLYAKDYFSKYLEIDIEDYTTFSDIFNQEKLTTIQMVNSKKAKDIFIKELTNNVIKEEDCIKEKDTYTFMITTKELNSRIQTTLLNLSRNDNFLNCFEKNSNIKKDLEDLANNFDNDEIESTQLEFTLDKKLFSKTFSKLVINIDQTNITFENNKEQVNYKINAEGQEISGYIKNVKENNTNKFEYQIEMKELGKLTLKLNTKNEELKTIDKVDTSKITTIEALTEEEQTEILTKFQESKLFEIFTKVMESMNPVEDELDYDTDYDMAF